MKRSSVRTVCTFLLGMCTMIIYMRIGTTELSRGGRTLQITMVAAQTRLGLKSIGQLDTHKDESQNLEEQEEELPVTEHPFLEFQYGDKNLQNLLDRNCSDKFTVPPIVHYIWLNKTAEMGVWEYVSIISANRFLKPCFILIHGDVIPTGKWWKHVLHNVSNIIHVKTEGPKEVGGRKLGPNEHKADVLRLDVLIDYGGIFLDLDTYILRSFNPLRNYPLTLSRESRTSIANGLILSTKNHPFLRIWRLSYHTYDVKDWTKNSVIMAHRLNALLPGMVHLEQSGMIRLGNGYHAVYQTNMKWPASQYSVHLYVRFFKKKNYRISEIKKLKNTFGALSRLILFGSPEIINS